ncbi:hypothetical protein ACHHYP_06427 [Achlya hypogyna]|uniref:Uncharacterized protein n=1 Tax=Achlya hypogyna TaxID=1202772 RepID=A0A1V9YUA6_ACHHY|nr:hypothetical protein ACHHYP_06427 [Achlya hypogyna]
MGLVIACVVGCYLYQRIRHPQSRCSFPPPLLLNGQGYYLLSFVNWHLGNNYYIDKTTAIMAGILCGELAGRLCVLDIKTWRCISVTPSLPPNADVRFKHAIPLHL